MYIFSCAYAHMYTRTSAGAASSPPLGWALVLSISHRWHTKCYKTYYILSQGDLAEIAIAISAKFYRCYIPFLRGGAKKGPPLKKGYSHVQNHIVNITFSKSRKIHRYKISYLCWAMHIFQMICSWSFWNSKNKSFEIYAWLNTHICDFVHMCFLDFEYMMLTIWFWTCGYPFFRGGAFLVPPPQKGISTCSEQTC